MQLCIADTTLYVTFMFRPLLTSDDAPHVWNDPILNADVVKQIVFNLTDAIMAAFPASDVYAALGNHDWSPKSQLPPTPHPVYAEVADK